MRPPLTLRDLAMRRSSIVLALTLAAAALLGGGLWYWFNDLRRIAQGPEPVTLAQVSQMGVEAAGRWLEVTSDVQPGHLLKTTARRRRGGESVTNHFVLIKDKAVIVETLMSALPATFLAWSSVFEEERDYYQRARQQLNLWAGASRVPLSPLLLRTSAEVAFTQWATGSAIAVTAIILLVTLWRTLRAMQDFTRIGPIARLRRSVRAEAGLPALVAEIDRQLATLDPRARRTGPLLLPSWLVSVSSNTFSLMSASDVVWVAPYKVTRRLYSVIPVSRSHQILGREPQQAERCAASAASAHGGRADRPRALGAVGCHRTRSGDGGPIRQGDGLGRAATAVWKDAVPRRADRGCRRTARADPCGASCAVCRGPVVGSVARARAGDMGRCALVRLTLPKPQRARRCGRAAAASRPIPYGIHIFRGAGGDSSP